MTEMKIVTLEELRKVRINVLALEDYRYRLGEAMNTLSTKNLNKQNKTKLEARKIALQSVIDQINAELAEQKPMIEEWLKSFEHGSEREQVFADDIRWYYINGNKNGEGIANRAEEYFSRIYGKSMPKKEKSEKSQKI